MPRHGTKPDPHGRVRVQATLTAEEAAMVDRARGTIPLASWAREMLVRAAMPPLLGLRRTP